jgi:hypothetical protein
MQNRFFIIIILLVGCLAAGRPARANANGVGLGVSLGAVFPHSEGVAFDDVGLSWGFWVDIPIAWTFYLSPSTELYNIGGSVGENGATDVCLNFKFIIPLGGIRPFFGAAGGVTNMGEYQANVGLLGGLSFSLVGNLELFGAVKYKIIIRDPNIHMIHTSGGLQFVF